MRFSQMRFSQMSTEMVQPTLFVFARPAVEARRNLNCSTRRSPPRRTLARKNCPLSVLACVALGPEDSTTYATCVSWLNRRTQIMDIMLASQVIHQIPRCLNYSTTFSSLHLPNRTPNETSWAPRSHHNQDRYAEARVKG